MTSSLGKMPTTSVRRLISPLRLDWVGRVQLGPMLRRERHVGEYVSLSFVHEGCELGRLGTELICNTAPLGLCVLGIVLGEGGGDEGGDDAPAALGGAAGRA